MHSALWALPALVLGPVLALALAPLARLGVSEFDVFDFDCLANGSAERRTATINLLERIVPPRSLSG